MDNLREIMIEIIRDGYLEDRMEYSADDLESGYQLSSEQASDLEKMIQATRDLTEDEIFSEYGVREPTSDNEDEDE